MRRASGSRGFAPRIIAAMAGSSMIELLVAMAMGAVLLGAVMMTVAGSGMSGRKQDATAAMTENGQIAMSMLATSLRMTGFWQPQSEVGALDQPSDGLPMLRGCRGSFASPQAAWADLACAGDVAQSDAVAIRYEAGPTGTATAMDCAGRDVRTLGITMIGDRYFVRTSGATGNPALFCQPTSGGEPQLLVDDVERMTLRYGVSPVTTAATQNRAFDPPMLEGRTERYLQADELSNDCATGGLSPNSWCAVTAVRICVLMRSADGAADASPTSYVDCDGQVRSAEDRRIRRALSTTVSIRNRVSAGVGS